MLVRTRSEPHGFFLCFEYAHFLRIPLNFRSVGTLIPAIFHYNCQSFQSQITKQTYDTGE